MKRDSVKTIAQYEREMGISDSAPEGEFLCEIAKAEVRETNDGRPFLFVDCKITEGDNGGQHLFPRVEWQVNPRDDWDEDKTKRITAMVRQNASRFLKAVFGRELEDAPDALEIIGEDDDTDEIKRVMGTWADSVPGMPVKVKVSYAKDAEGERTSDFPRFAFSRGEIAEAFAV